MQKDFLSSLYTRAIREVAERSSVASPSRESGLPWNAPNGIDARNNDTGAGVLRPRLASTFEPSMTASFGNRDYRDTLPRLNQELMDIDLDETETLSNASEVIQNPMNRRAGWQSAQNYRSDDKEAHLTAPMPKMIQSLAVDGRSSVASLPQAPSLVPSTRREDRHLTENTGNDSWLRSDDQTTQHIPASGTKRVESSKSLENEPIRTGEQDARQNKSLGGTLNPPLRPESLVSRGQGHSAASLLGPVLSKQNSAGVTVSSAKVSLNQAVEHELPAQQNRDQDESYSHGRARTGTIAGTGLIPVKQISPRIESSQSSGEFQSKIASIQAQRRNSEPASIYVTIGHIEIKASPANAPVKRTTPLAATMSLDEYLRQRQGGSQ